MADLLETFSQLADVVRHPVLRLELFTPRLRDDDGDDSDALREDEPADDDIARRMEPTELNEARQRRGALLFAANFVFDWILDDLALAPDARLLHREERFADEYLPAHFRSGYDGVFLRRLLATAAKVAQDLASPEYSRPACTAEELALRAILQEWHILLDITELGQSWTDLSEFLFEDTDFEYLFDAAMDGIENDPLAHKTSGIEVRAFADWFAPFNRESLVHPYAMSFEPPGPELYDLTRVDADGIRTITEPDPLSDVPAQIPGLEPISDLVAAARQDARARRRADEWIPDETDPVRSFAELVARPAVSGLLTHQTGPSGEVSEVPVLSFAPHPAHPATGAAWAAVTYFSGRTELPLAAVVSFRPDATVRGRWDAMFTPPS